MGIISSPTLTGGEVGNAASFDALVDLISSVNLAAVEVIQGSKAHKLQIPVTLSCEVFEDSLGILLFEDSPGVKVGSGYYSLTLDRPTPTSTFRLSNKKIASTKSVKIEVSATSDTSHFIYLNNIPVECPGETIISEPMQIDGGSQTNRTLVRYIGGNVLNNHVLNDSDLQIDCAPGDDLSALSFRLTGTSQLILNPDAAGASQINLSGLTSDGTATVDNITANDITISVGTGFTASVAVPTAGGGGVTVVAPQLTLSITSLPIGCEVRIYDLDTALPDFGTELAGVESLPGTTFSWVHSKAGDDVFLQVFADGFKEYGESLTLLSVSQSINGSNILEAEDSF